MTNGMLLYPRKMAFQKWRLPLGIVLGLPLMLSVDLETKLIPPLLRPQPPQPWSSSSSSPRLRVYSPP